METSTKFKPSQVLHGLILQARRTTVRIADVPALARIIGDPTYEFGEECQELCTSRTIYIAVNSDQTYELISNWPGLKLDAAGSPATFADVVEIDRESNPSSAIELLRIHTTQVDPNRIATPDPELIKAIVKGDFDGIAQLCCQTRRRLDPRAHRSVCLMLGKLRLSSTTFGRYKKSLLGKSSEQQPDKAKRQKPTSDPSRNGHPADHQLSNHNNSKPQPQQSTESENDRQQDLFATKN